MTTIADSIKKHSRESIQAQVAITFVLVSVGMLFGTLFLAYAILRGHETVWPPMGMAVPIVLPLVSTILISCSSLFYWQLQKNLEDENVKLSKLRALTITSFLLGLGFCFSQLALWWQLQQRGIFVETGTFASLLHALTWIHAAHMLMGLAIILWLFFSLKKYSFKLNGNRFSIRVNTIGKFWHFLGVLWWIMFLGLFVF